jgi:hypothetical protein
MTEIYLNESDVSTSKTENSVGFYAAISTTVITLVTFVLAMFAVPIAGANCPANCIDYPYLDTVSQFPRDYLWMFSAIILLLAYVVLMVSIHFYAPRHSKIFSQIGLSFAMMATAVLLIDYFVQFSVVPISLMSGETDGITLLTQYNAHGIFIALEELGYLLMSVSFVFVAFVFAKKGRLETAVSWLFALSFVITWGALFIISLNFGLDRSDRFEVIAITINWFVLIINGILLTVLFRRQLKET